MNWKDSEDRIRILDTVAIVISLVSFLVSIVAIVTKVTT